MIAVHHEPGVSCVKVARVTGVVSATAMDELSVEEPLEIRIFGGVNGQRVRCRWP